MAIDLDFDLDSHIPDAVLDRQQYALEIQNAEVTKGGEGGSLMVRALIIDGPVQRNGKASAGREVTFFLTTDTSRLAEWPRLQAATRDTLKSFYEAAGKSSDADAGDFIGAKVIGRNAPRFNKNSGEHEENWTKFKPYGGEA